MPILSGPQRSGKSTLCRLILPPEVKGLFDDKFPFNGSEREQAEALRGLAIMEIADLAGLNHADLERLKACLTRTDDRIRLAYRRDPEPLPRTACFVGTTDKDEILPNDPAGTRRWVVIGIKRGKGVQRLRDYMEENRSRLWAEGLVLYNQGVKPGLPANLETLQREANSERRQTDSLESHLLENISDVTWPATVSQVSEALGFSVANQSMQHRIGRTLRNLKFEKSQKWMHGKNLKIWNPPAGMIDYDRGNVIDFPGFENQESKDALREDPSNWLLTAVANRGETHNPVQLTRKKLPENRFSGFPSPSAGLEGLGAKPRIP